MSVSSQGFSSDIFYNENNESIFVQQPEDRQLRADDNDASAV